MAVFEKKYKEGLSYDKAIPIAFDALKQSLGEKEKMSIERVEFAIIDEKGFRVLSEQEVKKAL